MDSYARDPNLLNFKTEKVRDTKWNQDPKPWIKSPFKKHTTSAESHLLFDVAKRVGPGNYADLGVMHGGSTATLAHGLFAGGHRGSIYAVDYFGSVGKGPHSGSKNAPSKILDYFSDTFPPEIELNICIGDISDWGRKIISPFKFVFIDGDHDYPHARSDFTIWGQLVEYKGLLAFHDTHFLSVNKVISEIGDNWKLIDHIFSIKLFQKIR